MFKEIKKLYKQGYRNIVGLDEAGRGPLAGPVIASAVALKFPIYNFQFPNKFQNSKFQFKNIKDSKKLSAKQRDEWYKILTSHSDISWGVGIVSEKIIDKINILEATKLAMGKAIKKLKVKNEKLKIDAVIIDGNFVLGSFQQKGVTSVRMSKRQKYNIPTDVILKNIKQKTIPKADEKIFLCAAASIIAKVTRDRIMQKMHKKYPQYGFAQHKGYGTKEHLRALRKHGPCGVHRITFKPIATFLAAKKLRKKLPPGDKIWIKCGSLR